MKQVQLKPDTPSCLDSDTCVSNHLPALEIEDTVTPKAAHSPIVHHHNVERQVANRPSLAGCRQAMERLRVKMLMRIHGLTEAQAQAIAVLIWGAS